MPLRYRLKVLLAINEITQKQLADITGIRLATVSAICTGKIKQIPATAIEKICEALHCQPGEIFEFVEEQKK